MFTVYVLILYFALFIVIKLCADYYNPIIYLVSFVIFEILFDNNIPLNINWVEFTTYFFMGFICAVPILYLTYGLVFFSIPNLSFEFLIEGNDIYVVIVEEVMWRFILLMCLSSGEVESYMLKNVLVLFVTGLFVGAHKDIGSAKNFVEMYFYSIVLLLAAYFIPGGNIGLHLGRNILCKRKGRN